LFRILVAFQLTLVILIGLTFRPAPAEEPLSEISGDERVIFFPTVARQSGDGETWVVPIHGWIFEPETDDVLRGPAVREFRERLGLDPEEASSQIFEERVRLFLVDNERGKRIVVRAAGETHSLAPSGVDGHFRGTLRIPLAAAAPLLKGNMLRYEAVVEDGDDRMFEGLSYFLQPEGTSVISDVDDTIKISDVLDKRELIRNTFLRKFRAVEGMAAAYSRWAAAGAQFHFVSASPWQLYEPLAAFTQDAGFPGASFHLKQVRLKDSSVLNLLEDPIAYKLVVIEPLMESFPKRRFILVGDSGEKDPEVYGALARKRPEQVMRIYIRDVSGEPADGPRYQEAFRDVPQEKWRLFRDPAELDLPLLDGCR
jgi:phosphatidate phosphatase APP1